MSAVAADAKPHIGRGLRLQWEPVQGAHVLLYPEGMVKLNQSAGEIMRRCDGERMITEIIAANSAHTTSRLLERVDRALYAAKRAGGGRWQWADNETTTLAELA